MKYLITLFLGLIATTAATPAGIQGRAVEGLGDSREDFAARNYQGPDGGREDWAARNYQGPDKRDGGREDWAARNYQGPDGDSN
ncbi:hypothetical protein F4778DRAFT_782415 [Xylariomycetidae sp. FL2044]|nr:hypothetical protein F4778DRAFT_782415 [Xylariomycetidae sp. FL2044]